jgi:hypothetical protein
MGPGAEKLRHRPIRALAALKNRREVNMEHHAFVPAQRSGSWPKFRSEAGLGVSRLVYMKN